jgi:hypothetical protein
MEATQELALQKIERARQERKEKRERALQEREKRISDMLDTRDRAMHQAKRAMQKAKHLKERASGSNPLFEHNPNPCFSEKKNNFYYRSESPGKSTLEKVEKSLESISHRERSGKGCEKIESSIDESSGSNVFNMDPSSLPIITENV